MPTLRKRSRREVVENPPQSEIPMEDHKHKKSEYELAREERIRENRERMGKLGLFDISLSLKPNPPSRPTRSKNPKSHVSLNKPSRRSTRLQNVARIHYTEEAINKRIYGKRRVKKTPPKLLPDSSYTWWKYGRKQIKGSIRDYFECSMVNCPARKYEDRAQDDPTVVIVTFNGEHTHPSF